MRVGIDIGGTFTDLLAIEDGKVRVSKVYSRRAAPERGALDALERSDATPTAIESIVHASTVATNAVIERRGAAVGLIVTKGFGDLLELQRQYRLDVSRLKYRKPVPVLERARVREVLERVRATGEVVAAPASDDVLAAARSLVEEGAESIAVCLLHGFRHPEHERTVGRLLQEHWPDLPVALSHEIAPEPREYERASTTVLSGYVAPLIDGYLRALADGLDARGFAGSLLIMQSNGGVLPAGLIRRHAVRTLLSGPAGGVTAARKVIAQLGIADCLTFDMGGTSTDVCLIRAGQAAVSGDSSVDGLPVRVPQIDIVTVGAGGGSLASVDAGGMLRVGPRSAGSDPGPSCYGRGGTEATVTDANVVLGLLRPERFLGGDIRLDRAAATAACADIGGRLGLDAVGAARAIIRVANANMQAALRLVSIERGVDPRDLWLVAYGGAGGQHAVALAEELGLRGVVVPAYPALFSAYGLLAADLQRDWAAPFSAPVGGAAALPGVVAMLRERAHEEFRAAGLAPDDAEDRISLDMRFPGQAFEVSVPVDEAELRAPARLSERFVAAHEKRYGHAARDQAPQITTARLSLVMPRNVPSIGAPAVADPPPEQTAVELEGGRASVPVVPRDALGVRRPLEGPALIEEATSVVFVPPRWRATRSDDGHLRIVPS